MEETKINEILLRFIKENGGIEFVRMIASGKNPCDVQKIVASAKAAICDIERFAGNPKSGLTDEYRAMYDQVVGMFGGDFDKARVYLVDKSGEGADSAVVKLYDEYVKESVAKAVSPDGLAKSKKAVAQKNVYECAKKNFKPVKHFDRKDAEAFVAEAAKIEKEPVYDDKVEADVVERCKRCMIRARIEANNASTQKEVFSAIGDYVRNGFKLFAIANENASLDSLLGDALKMMNGVVDGYSSFVLQDVKDAILGKGDFKPINRI